MKIISLTSSNKVLGQDPIHPHIGKTFRTTGNRWAWGCVIEDTFAVVSCVAFTKGIASSMNQIAEQSDSPDTAMFYTVYKTKEANQISELPTAVGAKALLEMVKNIDKSMPNINTFATLSPAPPYARANKLLLPRPGSISDQLAPPSVDLFIFPEPPQTIHTSFP